MYERSDERGKSQLQRRSAVFKIWTLGVLLLKIEYPRTLPDYIFSINVYWVNKGKYSSYVGISQKEKLESLHKSFNYAQFKWKYSK